MFKRHFLQATVAAVALATLGTAQAQNKPVKFQLDWRFEGPSALFLQSASKGYYKLTLRKTEMD